MRRARDAGDPGDDGRGSSYEAIRSGGVRAGGGMRGMADRVHALGGELAVHSTAGGTRVRAVIPCGS